MITLALAGLLFGVEAQTYQYFNAKKNYNKAKEDCESRTVDGQSGYLVVIQSEDEFNEVLGTRKNNAVIWIGNKPGDGNYDDPWDPSSPQTGDCVRLNKNNLYQDRSCTSKFTYVCEFPSSCSSITEPCDCTGDCGWSTTNNACGPVGESTTTCEECNTLDGCIAEECMDSGCPAAYDEMRICQCTEDCDDFGNCCSDVDECMCAKASTPCECLDENGCGWSTSKNMCVLNTESTTNCIECKTQASCKAGECMDNGCPTVFDPLMTCDCSDACESFGTCCSDVQACKCDAITEPCDCTGECGWSTTKGKCVLNTESTTNCMECATLDTCKAGECMDNDCPTEFDPLMTCQCNDECESRGNCCSDVQACKCDAITEPCDCTGECGWSSTKNKCELATDSQTECGECPTLGGCITEECEDSGCPDYDANRVCQCNSNCDDFGNCCSDVMFCRTEAPTEPPVEGPTDSPVEPTESPTDPPADEPTEGPTDPPADEPTAVPGFPNACEDENGDPWAMPEFGEKTCEFWMDLGLTCDSMWSDECSGQDHPMGSEYNNAKLSDNPKCYEKCGYPKPDPESDACECKDEFDWDGTTYYQCAVTETDGSPWCYVKGGADCITAVESDVNPGEFWVECDRCDCKDEFMFDGQTYTECTDVDDTREWCYVKSNKCEGAKASSVNEGEFYKYCKDDCECKDEFMWDGETYYGCTVTEEGASPWCYVDGGEECEYAIESTENPGSFYKECDACDCKVPFIFEGKKYKECTDVDDTREWCYVKNGDMCPLATKSESHKNEYYKYCDDCLCKDEFKWEGDTYYQCATTEVDGEPWCYVKGEGKCASATESKMRPGEFWVECERCECKDEFDYKGQTYTECTDVEDTMPWCYVKGGDKCEDAVVSTVTKGESYKYCQDMCSCMPEFEWDGQTYNGCTVTSEGGRPWCYVIGGELCETATESTVNSGMYYVNCDACECQEDFKYKGKRYFDCTDVDSERPWCYVKGGDKCAAATKSNVMKNQWWKYCDDCECKDEWKWEGNTITECTATEPEPARAWCYVKGDEKCLMATESLDQPGQFWVLCDGCDCKPEFMWDGETYTDCTVTSEGGKPWCYVKGGEECEEAKESKTNVGEFYKYCDGCDMCTDEVCEGFGACLLSEGDQDPGLQYTCDKNSETYPDKAACDSAKGVFCEKACEEDPCECMDEFIWEGKKYTECAMTEEGGKSWCYVKGGASCSSATASQKNPGKYYIEECGHPCDCKDSFEWLGVTYDQCTITDGSPNSWCYVKGGEECELAVESDFNEGEYYLENCGHDCDCKPEFKYKGTTYKECTEVDSAGYPWCYVKGGDRCEIATKSQRTSTKAYKYCDTVKGPCACKDSFEWEGITYNECTVTSRGGKSWCYVEGDNMCAAAVESKVNRGEYYIQNCGHDCDCKDEFEWDGTTYYDCTVTSVDGLPWCYVKGDGACGYAKESSVNIGEFYRYCGQYWMDRPCFERERLVDEAAPDDEFPPESDKIWARGSLDSTMFPTPGAELFHTLYRSYAEDKLCMKFGGSCTKISEEIIADTSGPYPVEVCQKKCEDNADCSAYVVEYDHWNCYNMDQICVIRCWLYEKCTDVMVEQDGDKYSEIFVKADDTLGASFAGKYDGPIMRLNFEAIFNLDEKYGLGIIPRNTRRRSAHEPVVDPLAILTRRRKIEDEDQVKTVIPGACGHHCADAESAECQKCCQTYDHETSWQCGTDSEAKCCNTWNSTCFWERGEHNFHHGCKDCSAPSEYGYWIDQAEAAYACQQLCTIFKTELMNFACNYWMAVLVPEEDRRRLMQHGFIDGDTWPAEGTRFESHICTLYREKPAVWTKPEKPGKKKKGGKKSNDPYISGKRTFLKKSEAMTNSHEVSCYNTGFPFGLMQRADLFNPVAYNGGKEAYQMDGTLGGCAQPNTKLGEGRVTSSKAMKSVWDCSKSCADKPESQCEMWQYNSKQQKCEMRVTKPASGRKPESVPEYQQGKDYAVSGDRTCTEMPNEPADCINGDCSIGISED